MAVTPNSIVTPQGPVAGTAKCTGANTNYDAPTASVVLLPTQNNGARITKVTVQSNSTNSATDLQLYASPDGGTTKRLIATKLLAAYTLSQTAVQTPVDFGFSDTAPLMLGAGESLYAAIGVSQTG